MHPDERLNRIMVTPDTTVGVSLKSMDESGDRIILVVSPDMRLMGVLTDGDVRRFILAARSLEEPVTAAMNPHPVTLPPAASPDEARDLMLSRRIECVPIVAHDGQLVSAVWWLDLFEEHEPQRATVALPVVVMAGGEGSRLSPYTTILPKPLLPLGEQTILEAIMQRFAAFGCGPFFVTVNYKAELIRAYLDGVNLPWDIEYVREDRPLGTAGSLGLLRERIASSFLLTNADIVVDADYADIVEHHRRCGNRITIVASMRHFVVPYGVCETAEGGALTRMTEKPSFDFLVSTGFYVMEPEVLDDVDGTTFLHVTDLINRYLHDGVPVGVYPVSEKAWIDIGEMSSLHEIAARFEQG